MRIKHLDHLVLTVSDLARTIEFYQRVLGLQVETFGDGRTALKYGFQKINLHQLGNEFEPKATNVRAGSADLCFIVETPMDEIIQELETLGQTIEDGPIERTGATGPIVSVYLRDPDGNLIELSNPL